MPFLPWGWVWLERDPTVLRTAPHPTKNSHCSGSAARRLRRPGPEPGPEVTLQGVTYPSCPRVKDLEGQVGEDHGSSLPWGTLFHSQVRIQSWDPDRTLLLSMPKQSQKRPLRYSCQLAFVPPGAGLRRFPGAERCSLQWIRALG